MKQTQLETIGIVVLVLAMLYVSVQGFFHDDLGFDFAGYAGRAFTSFDGFWTQDYAMGVPSGIFNQWLPALLPWIFVLLGLGTFTLPITLATFVMKLAVALAFIILGRRFHFTSKQSFLMGLLLVFNPITFKFLNRFYELTAWLFFILALAYFIDYLKDKKQQRSLALGGFALALSVLSHAIPPILFIITAIALSIHYKVWKQSILFLVLAGLISLFWTLPLLWFKAYSVLTNVNGLALQTTGIFASTIALGILHLGASVWMFKRKEFNVLFALNVMGAVLAGIITIIPSIPVLGIPFAHSYHMLFIIILLLTCATMVKQKVIKKQWIYGGIALIVIVVLALYPIVERQYVFEEPRFSDTPYTEFLYGDNVKDFEVVEEYFTAILIATHDTHERFEILPNDVVAKSYAENKYHIASMDDFSYFPVKDADVLSEEMLSMPACSRFKELALQSATKYWISYTPEAKAYLEGCELEKIKQDKESENVALFRFNAVQGIVEGGKLEVFRNTFMQVKAEQEKIIVKVNYFPKWHAFIDDKEIEMNDLHPGMQVRANAGDVIEFRYGMEGIEMLGYLVSLLAVLFTALLYYRKIKLPEF